MVHHTALLDEDLLVSLVADPGIAAVFEAPVADDAEKIGVDIRELDLLPMGPQTGEAVLYDIFCRIRIADIAICYGT